MARGFKLETIEAIKKNILDNLSVEQSGVLCGIPEEALNNMLKKSKNFYNEITLTVAQRDQALLKRINQHDRSAKYLYKSLYPRATLNDDEKEEQIDWFKKIREKGKRRIEMKNSGLNLQEIERIIEQEFAEEPSKGPNALEYIINAIRGTALKRRKKRGTKPKKLKRLERNKILIL